MKRSTITKLSFACVLLFAGACQRTLTIDDGMGQAGAASEDGQAGEAGRAGDDGEAGAMGEAGAGIAGATDQSGGAGGASGSTAGDDGAAGAAGETGDGWGGSNADSPLATTHWVGNQASCSSSVPQNESQCGIEEGQVCSYYFAEAQSQGQSFYSECACRAFCGTSGTELHWDCYRSTGSTFVDCPDEQPETGSSCFGSKGTSCLYPPWVTCECPSDPNDSSWRCVFEAPAMQEHPSVVDENAIVSELTEQQRAAFCAWYAPPVEPGFPEPPVREPNANGFYPYSGCAVTEALGCTTNLPTGLPAAACEANLALSTCEATMRDLIDCVLSAQRGNPSPNGCPSYLATPGCSGTLVNGGPVGTVPQWHPSPNEDDESCLVRVR